MRIHLKSRLDTLREGFWFLPSAFILTGFLLGNFMIRLDQLTQAWSTLHLKGLFPGDVEWAKAFLTTIAAGLGAAVVLVISTTIIALTLASQQFGPRLLRNFLRDSTTKSILGMYFATAIFGFVVRFRLGQDFIPYFSILFMGVLATFDMFLLILFVHHVSLSIHVSNVMARVSRYYSEAVEKLFPPKLLEPPSSANAPIKKMDVPPNFDREARPIASNESGYIQNIDYEYLLDLAQEQDILIKIHPRPGEFIIQDTPLASIWPGEAYSKTLFNKVNDSIYLGNERTLTQDVEFAINQLVEIAVRALSPAINDPFTAVRCINRLAQGLVELAQSQMPSPYLYDSDRKLRLIVKVVTFPMMVDASFNLIRQNGLNSPLVMKALLEALGKVSLFVQSEEDRTILKLHAEMVHRGCQKALPEEFDREWVEEEYEAVIKKL